MKKLFALTLAALMAAGTTTVAFAANEGVYIDPADTYYVLGSDNRAKAAASDDEYEGGDKLVIPVSVYEDTDKDGKYTAGEGLGYLTYTSDYDRNVTVRADWKVGKDLGAEVDVDWVNYSKVAIGTPDSQIMSVIITLPENETTKVEDLAGTIRVGRTSSAAKKGPAFDLEVSFFSDATLTNTPNFDGGNLPTGSTGIVTFDKEARCV